MIERSKTHVRYVFMPVLLALAVSGCSLQPEYQRPELPVTNNYWDHEVRGSNNASDLDWQQFFSDPALRQLLQIALVNNRDMQVAALNVESARAQFHVDRAALLPTVSAGADQTSTRLPGGLYNTQTTGPVTYQQYEANLGITSWEIDFFGRLRSLRDQALETYLSTEATAKATRISLMGEVASGYLTLCADSDLLRLAHQTADSQRATYELTRKSYDVGASTAQDLAQAETTVRSAEADIAQYTRQVREDTNALRLLLGAELPAGLVEQARLERDWGFPDLPAGLPSELLNRRPDIISAEHTLKAANANIGAARAAFFPTISLTASGGSASSSLGHLLEGGTAAWSFAPSISVPIFDGGKNRANLDIAEVSKRIEVANYEKSIQTAFKEVSDALAGRATYKDELKARIQDTDANQRDYDLSLMRFHAGVDDFLDVLVAQRSLYQAQQSLITTQLNSLNQQVTLYKVLGGGWRPD
ncbi:TPA: efflux transporter outer membrane subunit [Klebsiella michiganensis]|nr:efflux transporter outer membrane subunit [Klebsiella michiganensis]